LRQSCSVFAVCMGKQCKRDSAIFDLGRANHYRLAVPVTCSARGAVRESRWSRVTSLGLRAMPSVVVALCFPAPVCAFAESADAQPRALAPAAAVRVPMLFTGSVAVGYPQCDPYYRRNRPSGRVPGPSRIPSLDPLWSGKRWMSGNETRRVVPTNKGRRTTIAGALRTRWAKLGCDPSTNRSAPRDPRTLAMVQGATPDAAFRTNIMDSP